MDYNKKQMKCTTCGSEETKFLGKVPVRIKGGSTFTKIILGELAEYGEELYPIDVYRCAKCGHLELYDLDFSLPQNK